MNPDKQMRDEVGYKDSLSKKICIDKLIFKQKKN